MRVRLRHHACISNVGGHTVTASLYHQLDETDRRIVDLLREDGRMPFREIGRQLDVSESMVRKRVTRLLDQGWMKIQAISDPLKLGVPVVATTYATVKPGQTEDFANRMAAHPAVRYAAVGIGNRLVVESLHADHKELHAFLESELGRPGIETSETLLVVDIKKSVWDWAIPGESDAHTEFNPLARRTA
jgi:Lrp/AsnC family transcriptional regulator for asnA, asnC and gidA